jgi:hypothetical protein
LKNLPRSLAKNDMNKISSMILGVYQERHNNRNNDYHNILS